MTKTKHDDQPVETPGALNQNQTQPDDALPPVQDSLTLSHVPGHEPTGGDGRPDGFVPGDQTAAGALTPPGAQHPGEPSGIPGIAGNLLDPHNVNGTAANQTFIQDGSGLRNPDLDTNPNAEKEDKNDD